MKLLAISGSTRRASTNTALLQNLSRAAAPDVTIKIFDEVGSLPIFSPDLETGRPDTVRSFISQIAASDGLIIASPEYVRAIPGGLKNAIDWLVSGDAIINKPIAIVHASHRGEDMLAALRMVLATISTRFNDQLFIRFPLVSKTPQQVAEHLGTPESIAAMRVFLGQFQDFITK